VNQKQAEALGDELRDLITARTGLRGKEIVCPREKSEMTPCVARDGGMCVVEDSYGNPICVGCETFIKNRVTEEKARL